MMTIVHKIRVDLLRRLELAVFIGHLTFNRYRNQRILLVV